MIKIISYPAIFLAAIIGALLVINPVHAAGQSSVECGETFKQCQAECTANHNNDNTEFGPCMTVCSGKYAACDTGAVYDKAKPWVDKQIEDVKPWVDKTVKDVKPWLEEQANKAKILFDDLMKTYNSDEEPVDPQKKTKDNSI